MPLVPLAAAVVVPKAGAAMATAMALGTDDLSHHAHDLVQHAQEHVTAFIQLPMAKQRIFDMFVGPEVAAYHWAHAKIAGIWEQLHGADVGASEQGRMVDYYATGCHHCKDLEPIWKDASSMWAKQGGADASHVSWQQKQCLDENWKPGPDFKECEAAGINSFPTVKFFAPGSKTGEDFMLDRTPEQLVDFAKTGISPDPLVLPRAPGDMSDMKLVDFYAASCPHCKTLEPVWNEAHKQWDKAIGQPEGEPPREDVPLVSFEKKECYDGNWHAGKDIDFCKKFDVHGFPTIKLMVPDPHGHGFRAVDYTGKRTPEAIVQFLKASTGMQVDTPPAADHAVVPEPLVAPDQGSMVEYYASGCHHCKDLEPIWKDASATWAKEAGADAGHVVWTQKQCLDENWKPGPDFKECEAAHVNSFPTVKFFAPGSKTGEDFLLERTPEQLVDFAKTGISPDPLVMPRAPGDVSDLKLVDYYAASCPHCKHLEPVWDDAHKQWDKVIGQPEGEPPREDVPLVTFEKKECYDGSWQPGKDISECNKLGVHGFPTVKLMVPEPHGHGFRPVDYTGARTPEGIVEFLKTSTGMIPEEPTAAAAAGQHGEGAAAPADADLPQALKEVVKTAMVPLPLLGLSCLPVRRSSKPASPQRPAPVAPAQFI